MSRKDTWRRVGQIFLSLQFVVVTYQSTRSILDDTPHLLPLPLYGCLIAFSFFHLLSRGTARGLVFFGIISGLTAVGELWGQRYGLLGARYHYNLEKWHGPSAFGLPVLVPLMWFAVMHSSFEIATDLLKAIPASRLKNLALAAVGALMMTLWDLLLDPISVHAGLWKWEGGPFFYFDVPIENLLSWLGGTMAVHLILRIVDAVTRYPNRSQTPHLESYLAYGSLGVLYAMVTDHIALRIVAVAMVTLPVIAYYIQAKPLEVNSKA